MTRQTFFLDQGETLGGAERFLIDFFRDCSASDIRRLHPVILGAMLPEYRTMLPTGVETEDFECPSVRGNIFKRIIVFGRLLCAARRLAQRVRQVGTDDITIFSNTARTHLVMCLARKIFRLRGRWIVMMHDFTVPRWAMKPIGRGADIIVVNALVTREDTRTKIDPRDYDKIQIIENGIDFDNLPSPQPPKHIRNILSIGRIDPRKGQLYALKAASRLLRTAPDVRLTVVGAPFEGDPDTVTYHQECHRYAERERLTNVTFLPEVADPFAAILSTDMVLFLPTVPETFGRVAIEGLAMGKVVLAFDEIGPRETFRLYHREANLKPKTLLVDSNDPEKLAEKILFFIQHPEDIPPVTRHARTFVEKHYDLHHTTKRMLQVLLG